MPVENWNGKFLAVGNGGWAGNIETGAMGTALDAAMRRRPTTPATTGRMARTAPLPSDIPKRLSISDIAPCTK